MTRKKSGLVWVLPFAAFLAFFGGCGKEQTPKIDERQAQANKVEAAANDLEAKSEALRARAEEGKKDLAGLGERLKQMQTTADDLKRGSADLRKAVGTLIKMTPGATANNGWPWYVTAFWILVVVVLVYLAYKVLTRDSGGEEGDEEGGDDSFVEETGRGSVRYPGTGPGADDKK